MPRIDFPAWVYKTLEKYGNIALPNSANKYDSEQLRKHFTYKTKVNCHVRIAKYEIRSIGSTVVTYKNYYIIETQK